LGLHPEPLLFRHKNQTCLKSRFFTGDYSDDRGINANLKASIEKTKLQMGGTFEGHESSILKLEGEFLPIASN
jgi:hypothetical protein